MRTVQHSIGYNRFLTVLMAAGAVVVAMFLISSSARAVTIPGRTGTASPSKTGSTGTSPAPVVIITGSGGGGPIDTPAGN